MAKVFIALGSNLDNREEFLTKSIKLINEKCKVIRKSTIHETEPEGYLNQGKFLNQVIEIKTELEPKKLLSFLLSIEEKMGRIRTFKNAPRKIDLDILFYDYLIHNNDFLCIPHPRLHKRKFVLEPLFEIAPEFVHPILKKNVKEMIESYVVTKHPKTI